MAGVPQERRGTISELSSLCQSLVVGQFEIHAFFPCSRDLGGAMIDP